MTLPAINVEDNAQNAFVQSWLTAYFNAHAASNSSADMHALETVIECVQETYDGTDAFTHEQMCAVLTTHPTEPFPAHIWHSGGGIFCVRVDFQQDVEHENVDDPHVLIQDRHEWDGKPGIMVGFYRTWDDEDGWPDAADTAGARFVSRLEDLHGVVKDAAVLVENMQADAELADMAASEAAEDAEDAAADR